MEGNPTDAMGLADYLGWQWKSTAGIPIVCVPGCPVLPDNFMETLLYLLYQAAGSAPMIPLDDALRPTWLFGQTVHEGCNRGGYYEQAGVVRDMFQNHLLQLLCATAMEPPVGLDADSVRDEKGKLLKSVRPVAAEEVAAAAVRGQYGPSRVDGQEVPGYRQEPGVAKNSPNVTYAAIRFFIDNWRWEGVPFYLRSGKRMPKRVTEVAIQFKRPPMLLFKSHAVEDVNPNVLVMRIQPDEGVSLTFEVKPPGHDMIIRPLCLDFDYEESFGNSPPEAYETLLEDCIEGDSTLFTRHDWVELAWSLVDPIIQVWNLSRPRNFPNYEAASWGPKEADEFMAREGRRWRKP